MPRLDVESGERKSFVADLLCLRIVGAMVIHKCVLAAGNNFGALKGGFSFDIEDGYTVLVGENDSGKTSILQFVARTCFGTPTLFGVNLTGFIPTERDYVDATTETQGGNLHAWNEQINQIWSSQNRPLSYANAEIVTNLLPKLFITHSDFMRQTSRLNEL